MAILSPSSATTWPLYCGMNGRSGSCMRSWKQFSSLGHNFLRIVPLSPPILKLPAPSGKRERREEKEKEMRDRDTAHLHNRADANARRVALLLRPSSSRPFAVFLHFPPSTLVVMVIQLYNVRASSYWTRNIQKFKIIFIFKKISFHHFIHLNS
jgi:hypothetical protein